jgi:hypothetical protein
MAVPLDVPLIQFAWDKKGEMHVYLGEKTKGEKEKRKENELTATAKTIFVQKRYYTYQELADKLQEYPRCKRTYRQRLYQIYARKGHNPQRPFKDKLFCDRAQLKSICKPLQILSRFANVN